MWFLAAAIPCLLASAATAPAPAPMATPAWESDARALEISRTHAEDALLRLANGGGDVARARTTLAAMLDDATRYENDLDAFTGALMGSGMPLAAAERNSAYLDAHRARHRALAAVLAKMSGSDARAQANEALKILAEPQSLPARDAASAVQIRSVRRIPPRVESGDFRELDATRVRGDDHPQDLAPPPPDLIAFARTLGRRSPADVVAWVRQAISPAPWHGEALGPAGCLRDRRCGAFDATSLAVALLRARGTPARIAYGVVEADAARIAARLLGGADADEVADALALGGVPSERDDKDPRRIRFEHVWVRAKVEGSWIDLDPVFDPRAPAVVPVTELSAPAPVDAAAILARYLSDPADRTPFGADVVPPPRPPRKAKSKRPAAPSSSAAPFTILFRAAELASVPPAYRGTLGLAIGGKAETPLIEARVPLADAIATGLLFYPRPPSELDRKIVKALGESATSDPANRLPPHLYDITTVVSAGGHEIAALPPIAIGSTLPITITFFPPNGNPVDVSGWAQAGAPAAITVVPFAPGSGYLRARWHDADVHPESSAGFSRALAATGAQFFADLLEETGRLAERAGGHRVVSPSAVLVAGAWHAPSALARAPLFTDAAGLTVDVGRLDEILLSRPGARPVEFEVASGAALSAWEARALRIATGLPAVSTVVAAKAGAASGGAAKILRGRAKATDLAGLSPAGRAEVRGAIASGLVAVVPRAPQALERWIGESYVLLDPRSGRGAYLVRGTLHGAVTTDAAASLLVPLREGGDASGVLAVWKKNRAGRAILAREGWPVPPPPRSPATANVSALLAASAARESIPAPSPLPWPPFGGKSKAIELGAPISLGGVGPVLWLGSRTRVLDPVVAKALAADKNRPATFDPKTRLWSGPTGLAIVKDGDRHRLLPIPARY